MKHSLQQFFRPFLLSLFLLWMHNMTLAQDTVKKNDSLPYSETLDEVVTVGTRSMPTTMSNTPLPVDMISAKDLKTTGQVTFDQALQYKIPSFNSVNMPVQDANSLLDPYEIRNLGSSRTLILINGKRKNMSAITYLQSTLSKGEVGADLAAIPISAIKNIEILRDGASAQYGSDAIAGVVNVVLKEKVKFTEIDVFSGIRHAGDGLSFGGSLSTGKTFKNGAFIMLSAGIRKQYMTNINNNSKQGAIDPYAETDKEIGFANGDAESLTKIKNYLQQSPSGYNVVGLPDMLSTNFLINAALPLNQHIDLYFNGATVIKSVNSYHNYRQNYWVDNDFGLLHKLDNPYLGFLPNFIGNMNDFHTTLGIKSRINGWKVDISGTAGGNYQRYMNHNTINLSLKEKSPTSFKSGGYSFTSILGNIDIAKRLRKNFSLGLGTEIRREIFSTTAGEIASFTGEGTNGFPGFDTLNAGSFHRTNWGIYIDASWDITKNWLLDATARLERYSDFGNAFVWKLSSRYALIPQLLTIRSSLSTGFRAPSLHQKELQVSQANFSAGAGIRTEGILRNSHPAVRALGVPQLKAEHSLNITAGITYTPNSHINIAMDYYHITIKDRIVLSSRLEQDATANTELARIMQASGVSAMSFFINGLNTTSQGLDFIASYNNLALGAQTKLNINFAANYNHNRRQGEIKTPELIRKGGGVIYDRTEESIILIARPQYKAILGITYVYKKLNISLNNTLFGTAKFVNPGLIDANLSADVTDAHKMPYLEFKPRTLTDIVINYKFNTWFSMSFAAQNILNITPKFELKNLPNQTYTLSGKTYNANDYWHNIISFNGRYGLTSYDAAHFNINGTMLLLTLNIKLFSLKNPAQPYL